ncbi:MAG: cysteine-rich CWC family protein [Chitinophagaceae bacterium]|nr:cysteine-rich CWC family protein [Chitinophagaceae bacterium]
MCRHEIKNCPRCQQVFECKPGNIAQCQCYGIALTAEQRAYAEQRYADCLCAACLQQLAQEWDLFKEKYVYR